MRCAIPTTRSFPDATIGTQPSSNLRRLLATFCVTQTVGFVGLMGAFPVMLSAIATDLDASRTQVALASTVATLAGAGVGFPAGRLLDRRGGRLTMTLGSILGAIGVLVWSQADNLLGIYLAFVIIGVAQSMSMYEAAFAVIVAATDRLVRERTILSMTMIVGLTTYLASPALGWMEAMWGWRCALVVLGCLMLATTVPGHLWAVPGRESHSARAPLRTGIPVRKALGGPDFWLLAISFTAQTASMTAVSTMLVTYLRDIGHSAMAATTIPVAIGVCQIAARFGLSAFSGRTSVALVCVATFVAQGVGMMALPLAGLSVALAVVCVSAIGLGNGVGVIARPMVLADTFGTTQFASIMAVLAIPMTLSRALSPLLAAWIDNGYFLVLFGAMSLVAAAVLLPLARRTRHRGPRFT